MQGEASTPLRQGGPCNFDDLTTSERRHLVENVARQVTAECDLLTALGDEHDG